MVLVSEASCAYVYARFGEPVRGDDVLRYDVILGQVLRQLC